MEGERWGSGITKGRLWCAILAHHPPLLAINVNQQSLP